MTRLLPLFLSNFNFHPFNTFVSIINCIMTTYIQLPSQDIPINCAVLRYFLETYRGTYFFFFFFLHTGFNKLLLCIKTKLLHKSLKYKPYFAKIARNFLETSGKHHLFMFSSHCSKLTFFKIDNFLLFLTVVFFIYIIFVSLFDAVHCRALL